MFWQTPEEEFRSNLALKLKSQMLLALLDKSSYPDDTEKREKVWSMLYPDFFSCNKNAKSHAFIKSTPEGFVTSETKQCCKGENNTLLLLNIAFIRNLMSHILISLIDETLEHVRSLTHGFSAAILLAMRLWFFCELDQSRGSNAKCI